MEDNTNTENKQGNGASKSINIGSSIHDAHKKYNNNTKALGKLTSSAKLSNPATAKLELVKSMAKFATAEVKKKAASLISIIAIAIAIPFVLILLIMICVTELLPNSIRSPFAQTYETRDGNLTYKDLESTEFSVEDVKKRGIAVSSDKWWEETADILYSDKKIGYIGEEDITDNETPSDLTYNAENEYDAVTLDNKKLVALALKKAYEKALDEAKAFCRANNYSWRKCKKTLKETNSDSWEVVYKEANYGDIITALNMGYSKESNFETDFTDFNEDAFKKFVMRDDNMQYYYQIYYEQVEEKYDPTEGGTIADEDIELSEKQEAQYDEAMEEYNLAIANGEDADMPTREQYASEKVCKITITPYTLTTLYQMVGVNPQDEYMKDYTYEEHRLAQMDLLKELTYNIADEMGYNYTTPFTRNVSGLSVSTVVNQFNVVNGDNALTVWNALRANGYSRASAAGIMGNIQAESGFNINALSADGHDSYGICQWTYDRKTRLLQMPGYDTIEVQASYLISEIPGRMGAHYQTLLNVPDSTNGVDEACDWFAWIFESPCNFSDLVQKAESENCNKFSDDRFLPYSDYTNRYLLDVAKRRSSAQAFYADPTTYP